MRALAVVCMFFQSISARRRSANGTCSSMSGPRSTCMTSWKTTRVNFLRQKSKLFFQSQLPTYMWMIPSGFFLLMSYIPSIGGETQSVRTLRMCFFCASDKSGRITISKTYPFYKIRLLTNENKRLLNVRGVKFYPTNDNDT